QREHRDDQPDDECDVACRLRNPVREVRGIVENQPHRPGADGNVREQRMEWMAEKIGAVERALQKPTRGAKALVEAGHRLLYEVREGLQPRLAASDATQEWFGHGQLATLISPAGPAAAASRAADIDAEGSLPSAATPARSVWSSASLRIWSRTR